MQVILRQRLLVHPLAPDRPARPERQQAVIRSFGVESSGFTIDQHFQLCQSLTPEPERRPSLVLPAGGFIDLRNAQPDFQRAVEDSTKYA